MAKGKVDSKESKSKESKPKPKESNLKIEELENKQTKNGMIKKRVYKFTRKDGKNITYAYAKDIYNSFLKQGIAAKEIYVQVMSHRELTIKSLGEDDFKDWDNEEYYENRLNDTSEFFNNFQYVRIAVMQSGNRK